MTLPQGHLRPQENTEIYIMIHNSSKLQFQSSIENNFMAGRPPQQKELH